MRIPVDYNDPQTLAKLHVDALLERSSRFVGIAAGTTVPGHAGVAGPLVATRFEQWVARQSTVSAIARIRIGAWSTDADEAWDLASYLQAGLLAFPGDDEVGGYIYELGPSRELDPDNDVPFSAFTIRQRVRARIIDLDA